MNKSFVVASFFLFIFVSLQLSADVGFERILFEYDRMLAVAGMGGSDVLNFHIYSSHVPNNGPWEEHLNKAQEAEFGSSTLKGLGPESWSSFNTAKPWGSNDGAIWQGKGPNSLLSGGFKFSHPNFAVQIKPLIWYAHNSDFDIIDTSISSGYGDYWREFDHLQRHGDDPYYQYSWGQSYVRAFWRDLTIGVSTESIILGPGQMNNILLSDNAGGFPHIDVGTDGKTRIGSFGQLEFKWLWGMLEESEFYDMDSSNNYGWISGTYIAFSPAFFSNFTIGFNHQYYKPLSEWKVYDLGKGFPFVDRSNPTGDNKDMMMSIPFYWVFPTVGFEVYGEWARNDNFGGLEDLYNSPEHTHGFTLGFNQILREWSANLLQLSVEFTSLGQERTREVRAAGPWYRHGWSGWTQGYTYKGQLLGAAIGPGSDSQWMQVSWYHPKGRWALSVQRVAHDKDYYYSIEDEQDDVDELSEFNIGIDCLRFIDSFSVNVETVFIYLLNNNYEDDTHVANFHTNIGVKYAY